MIPKLHVENPETRKAYCGSDREPECFWHLGGVPYRMRPHGGTVMVAREHICKSCIRVMGVDK